MGIKAVLDTLISRGTKRIKTDKKSRNKKQTNSNNNSGKLVKVEFARSREDWNDIFPISTPVPLTDREIQNGRLEANRRSVFGSDELSFPSRILHWSYFQSFQLRVELNKKKCQQKATSNDRSSSSNHAYCYWFYLVTKTMKITIKGEFEIKILENWLMRCSVHFLITAESKWSRSRPRSGRP